MDRSKYISKAGLGVVVTFMGAISLVIVATYYFGKDGFFLTMMAICLGGGFVIEMDKYMAEEGL